MINLEKLRKGIRMIEYRRNRYKENRLFKHGKPRKLRGKKNEQGKSNRNTEALRSRGTLP